MVSTRYLVAYRVTGFIINRLWLYAANYVPTPTVEAVHRAQSVVTFTEVDEGVVADLLDALDGRVVGGGGGAELLVKSLLLGVQHQVSHVEDLHLRTR